MAASPSIRILLTGGRGCLAGVVRRHFAARSLEVTSLSRTAGGGHVALDELFAGRRLEAADTLIHLAWSSVPFSSERDPRTEWEQDLPLLGRILERLAASPARERIHFIFFSSGGTVYGNARNGRASREDDPCAPIGRHGQAKLAAERLIAEAGRRHGLCWTVLRLSNPYGFPVPAARSQGIVPIALKCARAGSPLAVWGDGTARKDFLHHSDFTAALEPVIRRRLTGIYNVCSGESHSINEIIALAEQAAGRKITSAREAAHPWDVHDSLLDNARICAATGWRPQVTLVEGLRRAVADLVVV